jgi:hypothetical protein
MRKPEEAKRVLAIGCLAATGGSEEVEDVKIWPSRGRHDQGGKVHATPILTIGDGDSDAKDHNPYKKWNVRR